MRSSFDVRVIPQLRRLLIERRVDILHSQGYRSNLVARLAVRLGRLPPKLLNTVHGIHHFPSASPASRLYYLLDYLTTHTADRVIAVSRATLEWLARWGLRSKMLVIHNGTALPPAVDLQARQTSRRKLGLAVSGKVVLFVGRLSPHKGIVSLLEIARKTLAGRADVLFLIVGDGELMAEVAKCAQASGGRMILAGQQTDLAPYYAAADVLILPSCTEGLPMVLLEACAWGLPAVASNVGGVPEVVTDGVNGFLCDSSSVSHMQQRVVQLLDDDVLRRNFGAQARSTIAANFSLERMTRATWQVYRSLIWRDPHLGDDTR
jgi:glycosyltransferase involved in cell wall biosynthesis